MAVKLAHLIRFVADMDKAVAFHRDVLGLPLKFTTPQWSEFATGETTLALHPASPEHPAGTAMAGYQTDDLMALFNDRERLGTRFIGVPATMHGALIGHFSDIDGAVCTIEQRLG